VVVKADGSAPPIRLANANTTTTSTSSWARWTPFQQSFGTNHETGHVHHVLVRARVGVGR